MMPGKTGERANPGAPQMARGRPERLTAVRGRITKTPAHGPRYGRRRLGNPMEERRWTGRPPARGTRCRPPPDAPRPPDIRIERQKKPNGRRSPPHAASPARAFSRPRARPLLCRPRFFGPGHHQRRSPPSRSQPHPASMGETIRQSLSHTAAKGARDYHHQLVLPSKPAASRRSCRASSRIGRKPGSPPPSAVTCGSSPSTGSQPAAS